MYFRPGSFYRCENCAPDSPSTTVAGRIVGEETYGYVLGNRNFPFCLRLRMECGACFRPVIVY